MTHQPKGKPFLVLVTMVAKQLHPEILRLQAELRTVDPRQTYHVSQYFHITVKLLGWLDKRIRAEDLPRIHEIVEKEIQSVDTFNVGLRGLSTFPDVAFVKVEDPNLNLRRLNKRLLGALGDQAVSDPYEGDNYTPHVTVATFSTRDVQNLIKKAGELSEASVGKMEVAEVKMVEFHPQLAYGKSEEQASALRSIRSFRLKSPVA